MLPLGERNTGTTYISNHCQEHPIDLPHPKIRLAVYEIDQPATLQLEFVSNKPDK